MKSGYVYCAGPIDGSDKKTRESVWGDFMERLRAKGFDLYSPHHAWHVPNGHAVKHREALMAVNEMALRCSSAVFAVMDGASVGVPAELQMARDSGIPAVVYAPDMVWARHSVLLTLATAGLHHTLADALEALERVLIITDESDGRVAFIDRDKDVRDLPLPRQAKPGDIGLDLYVSDDTLIPAGGWCSVPSRVRLAPPDDVWFLICGRSSTLHKRGILVPQSVIDSGYRGDIFSLCYNITKNDVLVKRGERVAQLVPLPLTMMHFVETDNLPTSHRGSSGFGSTGE
jgi:deoxyuridine 5'-triphosphate nucleotidohydrolase